MSKKDNEPLKFTASQKIKAKKFWNNLPPGDRASYRNFGDYTRSLDWNESSSKLMFGPAKDRMHLYGVEYPKKSYVKEFIPECYKNFKVAIDGTSLRNAKIKISEKTEGKYWNAKSKYPVSQNEFITKFFDDDEENVDGLEGIWEEDNWGLVGIVKKGSYYQKYNISIDNFDNKKVSQNFDNNDNSADFWQIQSTFEEPDDLDVDGTLDGAFIPTKNKNKFTYECRTIIMARVDNIIAPINVEQTMQTTILKDGLMQIRPAYGNDVFKSERIWPLSLNDSDDDFTGAVSAASGTAFFVDDKGHLISNYHVVKDAKDKLKIVYKNKEIKAEVIATDKQLDLALIKVDVKNKSYITTSGKKPEKLQDIIASGYPGGKHLSDDLKFTSGIISSLKGLKDNTAHIQTDLALNPGNSGGPIVDKETGQLVAVAVSGLRKDATEGINFGIKSSQVKDFLDSNRIKNSKWSLKRSIKRTELLSILEESTVYIFFK